MICNARGYPPRAGSFSDQQTEDHGKTILEFVKDLNFAVVLLFTLLYLYQGFYVVVGLVRRRWKETHQPEKLHRFAVVVSARNEEGVIGELLDSFNKQN